MTREELAKQIYKVAHITGEFTLRSGIISNEYFDKYQFEVRPQLLISIAEHLGARLPLGIDLLAGLEVGGIPIATAIGLARNLPMVFVRKEAKKYGTAKLVEGFDVSEKELLIVEDIITSGGQVILSAKDLRTMGAKITRAVCVIDREQGGREALAAEGIELISLFTMSELKKSAGVA